MLRLLFVLALPIAIVVVIFALQNAQPVTIQFLSWQFQGSLALVLLSTLSLGAVTGLLVSIPSLVSRSQKSIQQEKKLEELQDNLSQAVEQSKSIQLQHPKQS